MAPRRALYALAVAAGAAAIDNGVGLTPPMGWRSWNHFGLEVSQTLMEAVMAAVAGDARPCWDGVNRTLLQLGYKDVGLDDGWQACAPGSGGYHDHTTGRPNVNTSKFPDMKGMVGYAHSLGLTAGWYGNNCWCASKATTDCPDVVKCVQGDVAAFRDFAFDGYKLDSCGNLQDIQLWATLLNTSGAPVVIENCHNGAWDPEPPRKPGGSAWCPFNFWRTSTDIVVNYGVIMGMNLRTTLKDAALAGPGCWGYPDMLEVGVPPGLHPHEVALTPAEARAHFGAWAVVSSPLVLGMDVTNGSLMDAVWPIVSNTEAIAVNQAWAGGAGALTGGGTLLAQASEQIVWSPCGWWPNCTSAAWELWAKPLPNASVALLLLNHGNATQSAGVTLPLASVPGLGCAGTPAAPCAVRDVWAHADAAPVSNAGGVLSFPPLASHDSALWVASPPVAKGGSAATAPSWRGGRAD